MKYVLRNSLKEQMFFITIWECFGDDGNKKPYVMVEMKFRSIVYSHCPKDTPKVLENARRDAATLIESMQIQVWPKYEPLKKGVGA